MPEMRAYALLGVLALGLLPPSPLPAVAAYYYVRDSTGDDRQDGRSPARAFKTLGRLARVLRPGDTAYVGPGLYRQTLIISNFDADGGRTVIVADTAGRRVGDPPGPVVVTGADPIDPELFEPGPEPGTYVAHLGPPVHGVVEMAGSQARYLHATETDAYVVDKVPEEDVVASVPSTFRFDADTRTLQIHTSDGRPPREHRLEIIRRRNGFFLNRARNVTIKGFVLRHSAMAGIEFFNGSDGGLAAYNVSFGHHQGIQVHSSSRARLVRNVLFRNTNAGAYFIANSLQGRAVGNTAFENVKGIRVGSQSIGTRVLENHLFANGDAGLSIEYADDAFVRRNGLVSNGSSQLLVIDSDYDSDHNCFTTSAPTQATADFFHKTRRYGRLDEYVAARGQDRHSRDQGCDLPSELPNVQHFDVHDDPAAAAPRERRVECPHPPGQH
jgi:hypothetical protein